MTSLSADEVKKIANLAKLHINTNDLAIYAEHLSGILKFVDQISEVNTDGFEPMSHPVGNMVQRLRRDEITERVDRNKFQALSAHHEAGLYLVPLVIDAT